MEDDNRMEVGVPDLLVDRDGVGKEEVNVSEDDEVLEDDGENDPESVGEREGMALFDRALDRVGVAEGVELTDRLGRRDDTGVELLVGEEPAVRVEEWDEVGEMEALDVAERVGVGVRLTKRIETHPELWENPSLTS